VYAKLRYSQRGDTIVEVLLAIVIIASVLAHAFTASRGSLRATQDNQERHEAVGIAQTQVELLRLQSLEAIKNVAGSGDYFCINNTGDPVDWTGNTIPNNAQADTLTSYPNECKNGLDDRYHYSIQKDTPTTDTYTFRARWNKLGGGINEVIMFYRRHEGDNPPAAVPSPPVPPPPPGCPASITFTVAEVGELSDSVPYSTLALATPIPAGCTYSYSIVGREPSPYHSPAFYPDAQPYEQAVVVGLGSGNVNDASARTFNTGATPDIPWCQNTGQFNNPNHACHNSTPATGTVTIPAETTHISFVHISAYGIIGNFCSGSMCSDSLNSQTNGGSNSLHGADMTMTYIP